MVLIVTWFLELDRAGSWTEASFGAYSMDIYRDYFEWAIIGFITFVLEQFVWMYYEAKKE